MKGASLHTADEARELTDQCRILANAIFGDSTVVGGELDDCAKDGYTRLAGGETKVATSGISDPTYALVVAPDEAADDRASFIDALRTARKYLAVADGYRAKWKGLAGRRPKREPSGLRFGVASGCSAGPWPPLSLPPPLPPSPLSPWS